MSDTDESPPCTLSNAFSRWSASSTTAGPRSSASSIRPRQSARFRPPEILITRSGLFSDPCEGTSRFLDGGTVVRYRADQCPPRHHHKLRGSVPI